MNASENPAISDGAIDGPATQTNQEQSNVFRLTPAAAKWLDEWCDAIADGSMSLGQLPLPVVSLYLLGYAHAEYRYACNHSEQITRIEHERDLWYFVANNPGKRPGDFMRAHTDLLWKEGSAA